ncbi:hypothetical protein NKDENANG_00714 [Candidatus Entotheonellaceae bacterium PAL068K]
MSDLLRRLTRLTRAQLYDVLAPYWRNQPQEPRRAPNTGTPHGSETMDRVPPLSHVAETHSSLPYSEEIAAHYRALDLPFGAPLAQVTKRWKTYLKQCHPDRYVHDSAKQADATSLTQELTRAHEHIKAAWEQQSRRV